MSESTVPEPTSAAGGPNPVLVGLAWLWVAIPLAYGIYQLLVKIPALFGS